MKLPENFTSVGVSKKKKKKQQYAQIALGFLYLGELHLEVCNLDMQPTGSIYMQLICISIKCQYKKVEGVHIV